MPSLTVADISTEAAVAAIIACAPPSGEHGKLVGITHASGASWAVAVYLSGAFVVIHADGRFVPGRLPEGGGDAHVEFTVGSRGLLLRLGVGFASVCAWQLDPDHGGDARALDVKGPLLCSGQLLADESLLLAHGGVFRVDVRDSSLRLVIDVSLEAALPALSSGSVKQSARSGMLQLNGGDSLVTLDPARLAENDALVEWRCTDIYAEDSGRRCRNMEVMSDADGLVVCGSMHNFAYFFDDSSPAGTVFVGSVGFELGLLTHATVIGRRGGGFEVLVTYTSKAMEDMQYVRTHGEEYVAELWHIPCDGCLLHAPGRVLLRCDHSVASNLGATQFFEDAEPYDW